MKSSQSTTPALPDVKVGRCELGDFDGSGGYVAYLEVNGTAEQFLLLHEVMKRFNIMTHFNEHLRGKRVKSPIVLRTVDDPRALFLWMPNVGSWSTAKRRVSAFVKFFGNYLHQWVGLDESIELIWSLVDPETDLGEQARALREQQERGFLATYSDEFARMVSS